MARRAFTLLEGLIALGVAALVMGIALALLLHGSWLGAHLTPQLSLEQNSRRALVRLLAELQEGMEVVNPRPGGTATFAVIRDRVSRLRMYYQVAQPDGTAQLWRYTDDADLAPAARRERLLAGVRRLTFSSRSEGALQINLLLSEGGQDYALLTAVRLRNLASAEEIW